MQLACTAAMPPGPVKAVLCSSISSELAKLAKPVLSGVVTALSSSPPDVLRLVSILGPGLACKVDVIPAAMREIACGALGEILAAGKELAEGLAELAGLAVEAAGYVFDAGDKVLGSYHEKQTPKAYFKAYWANATHLGAWLKYVKGDAILGILVVAVNILGGIFIGVVQKGMPLAQAGSTYTLLTVGDGLVSQVPALIISTAAGLMVPLSLIHI